MNGCQKAGLYRANVATANRRQITRLRFRGDASNSLSIFCRTPVDVGAAGCCLVSDRWLPDLALTDMSTPETLCTDSQNRVHCTLGEHSVEAARFSQLALSLLSSTRYTTKETLETRTAKAYGATVSAKLDDR